jgi:hypothetical protein
MSDITTTQGISDAEAFALLNKADESKMELVTNSYFKFEQKGRYTFKVLGIETAPIGRDGEEKDVVRLLTPENREVINGDSVLVSSCKNLGTLPQFIIVMYANDITNKQGTYKDLKVFKFPTGR